jgi:hypothetical protein
MPENNPIQNDWFLGQTDGTISTDLAKVAEKFGDKDFSMLSKNKYWDSKSIQDKYRSDYGDNAREKFDADYKSAAQSLQTYDSTIQDYKSAQNSKSTALIGTGHFYGNMEEKRPSFQSTEQLMTDSGALMQGEEYTEQLYDSRKRDIDARKWVDDQGKKHDMPSWWDTKRDGAGWMSFGDSTGSNAMRYNENYTSADGRRIVGWGYGNNGDPYNREEGYITAIYENDFAKEAVAGTEYVSIFDYAGFGDMGKDAAWYDFATRTAFNGVTALYGAVGAFGANTVGLLHDDARTWFEDNMITSAKSATVSQHLNNQAAGITGSVDGFLGFAGDVVMQLVSGRAAGTLAASLVGGKLIGGTAIAASKAAKYSSTAAMTIYGGADMYENSLANGFSRNEATTLYALNLGALFGVNRMFNWMDDTFTATKVIKNNAKWMEENAAYGAFSKSATLAEETAKKAHFMRRAYDNTKSFIIQNKDAMKSYPSAALTESLEEMAEMLSEETIKQAANFYVWSGAAGRDYADEPGQGRFKDMWDKDYWSEFAEGMLASAGGGAIGGIIGKKFFHSNQQDAKVKTNLVDVILGGEKSQKAFFKQMDALKKEGKFGSTTHSTTWDEETGAFKTMDSFDDKTKAMSMNDANHQILQHEFNYVKNIVDGLGSADAVKAMMEQNDDFKELLNKTNLVQDVRELTQRYLEIGSEVELEVEKVEPRPEAKDGEEITEEKLEAHIADQAKKQGLTKEQTRDIESIKSQLRDIQTGKASDKYYLEAAAAGSLFDPNVTQTYEKFGKFFLNNMMKASAKTAEFKEVEAEEIKKKVKDNDDVVNSVDAKTLDGLEAIEKLLSDGENTYLSEKAREKIIKLAQNYKVPKEELNQLKDQIREQVETDGRFNLSTVMNGDIYKAINKSNPELGSKLGKFVEAFYKTKLEQQLDSIKTMAQLNDFNVDTQSADIIELMNVASLDGDYGMEEAGGDLLAFLEGLTEEQAATKGELVAKEVAKDTFNYDIDAEATVKNIKNSDLSSIISAATDRVNRLKAVAEATSDLDSEESYEYDPTDVDFFLNGYDGDESSVKDTGNLINQVNNLAHQASRQVREDGSSSFNNLSEVEELTNQVTARYKQIEILKAVIDDLAEMRTRGHNIANDNGSTSTYNLLSGAIKDSDKIGFTKLFNQTLINPVSYNRNKELGKDKLNGKELAEFEEQEKTLLNLQLVERKLAAAHSVLSDLKEDALNNQEEGKIEQDELSIMAMHLGVEARVIDNLMSMSGLLDVNNPQAKAFERWYAADGDVKNRTDEGLSEAFQAIADAKAVLFQLSETKKADTLDKFYRGIIAEAGQGILNNENRSKMISAGSALFFNQEEFYKNYKGIIGSGQLEGLPSMQQEKVAMTVAAHMDTDLGVILKPYVDENNIFKNGESTLIVTGLQGSGKSTYAIGIGTQIGQKMQADKYGLENSEILLASNSETQVNVLAETADEFGTKIKGSGAGKGKYGAAELIKLLENPSELGSVSTIVYDEATFIEYFDRVASTPYTKKSDLDKITHLIKNINSTRDGVKSPKIKLILLGDPNQNGSVGEAGNPTNLSLLIKSGAFSTLPLTYNYRSKITPLVGVTEELLRRTSGTDASLNKLSSNYGIINGKGTNLLGGVRFMKGAEAVFNDDSIIDNIKEQIDRYNGAKEKGGEKFKLGIILPDGVVLPDSKLKELTEDSNYSGNITLTTHTAVQGSEFSYVIALVNPTVIGNSRSDEGNNVQKEVNYLRTLSTTIGRARYFSLVINETERLLTSEEINTIVSTDPTITKEVTDRLRNLKLQMIPGEASQTNAEVLAKSEEEIEAQEKAKEEEISENQKELEAETNTSIEFDTKNTTIEQIEEDRYQDLYVVLGKNPNDQEHARNIEDREGTRKFIMQRANSVDRTSSAQINQIADAKIAILVENDTATKVAAKQKLENPNDPAYDFTQDRIIDIQKMIDNEFKGVSDDYTKGLYEAEIVELNKNKLVDSKINSVDVEEVPKIEEAKEIVVKEIQRKVKKEAEASNAEEGTDEKARIDKEVKLAENPDIEDEVDYEDESEDMLGNSSQEEVPEGETKEDRKKRLDVEAELEMEKMEIEGFIAAYSNNTGGYNGMRGAELDMASLEFINKGKINFPTNVGDYKALQKAAMGLKSGYSTSDFDYKFVGFKNGGYSTGLFVATEKKTGNQVIVGGLYQIQKLRKSTKIGGKLAAKLDFAIEANNGLVEWPIHNPKNVMSLDFLSPGEIVRGDKKMTLTEFRKTIQDKIPGINISDAIFASTKALVNGELNPHRGDAFLLYSFNDKRSFTTKDVDNLLKTGLSKHKNGVLKGYKDGIGIIWLDNKPTSFRDLNSAIRETFTPKAIELSKTVNSNAGAERMAVALTQIRVALNGILDNPIGIPTRVTNFLNSKEDGDKQFTLKNDGMGKIKRELSEWKNSSSDASRRAFNAFVETIQSVTEEDALGKFQLDTETGEYVTHTAKASGKVYPGVAPSFNNIMTILNGSDIGADVANEVRFELNKFFSKLQEASAVNKVDDGIVAGLFDALFRHSRSFENGLYMRPTVEKVGKALTKNTDFARVEEMPNISDMYNIRVSDINTPMIRFEASNLMDLMDQSTEKKVAEPAIKTQGTSELRDKLTKEISESPILGVLGFTSDEFDLDKQRELIEDKVKEWGVRVGELDTADSRKAKRFLDKFNDEFHTEYQKALKKHLNGDSEQTKESVDKIQLPKATNDLVNNSVQLEAEKEAVKLKAIKDGNFMKSKLGDDTKLSEDQWLTVRTASFKSWAGDWESKDPAEVSVMIDEETGEPRKFFHGSSAQGITEFETNTSRFGAERDALGSWFTDTEEEAFGFQVLDFTDPVGFKEKFGEGLSEEEITKLYNNVNSYIEVVASGQDASTFEGTEEEFEIAKNLVEGNSRMYEVFVKGTVQALGDPKVKTDINDLLSTTNQIERDDINRKREETKNSIKEGFNGGKTWEYTGQFSDQITKFAEYSVFQDEYTKDQVIAEIDDRYNLELKTLEDTEQNDADIIMFRNVSDGLVSEDPALNVTSIVVKDKANIYIGSGVKGGEVVPTTVNEEISPQMEEFKASMAEISTRFMQMSEFIFSTDELNSFLDDINGLLSSAEARVSKVLDAGTDSMAKVEKVVQLMHKNIENLSNRVRTNPEALRGMIRENMEKSFTDDQIPTSNPSLIPTLSDLLIGYHNLKNKGGDTTAIQREIGSRYLNEVTESAVDIQLRTILENPEASMEEFEAKAKTLRSMNLPKDKLKEALQVIADRVGSTMEFEKITALAAEGKLTIEEVNKLKESDFKTLLEDSFSELLTPEAEKIINSTWGGLEKFLSLPIENSAAAEIATKNLEIETAKAEAKFKSLLQFIGDIDKKAYLMEKFNGIKKLTQEHVTKAVDSLPSEVDMTVGSLENMFPNFTDQNLKVTLAPDVQDMVNKLEAADKSIWLAALNGELIHDVAGTSIAKLCTSLRKVTTPTAYTAIEDYLTKKSLDSICK